MAAVHNFLHQKDENCDILISTAKKFTGSIQMKFAGLILFLFLFSHSFFASNNSEVLKYNAKIGFTNGEDSISAHNFFDGGRKILLIGGKNLQIWDVESAKLLHSVQHQIPQFEHRGFLSKYILLDLPRLLDWRPFIVDPNGKWLITAEEVGESKLRSAVVRDLRDLKQIAVLDLPSGVSTEYLSFDKAKNEINAFGRTNDTGAFAVWGKDDFRLKRSFSVTEYKWHQYIRDNEKLLIGSGESKNFWALYVKRGYSLTLRDAKTGAVEKEFTAPNLKPKSSFDETSVSGDEKFLAAESHDRIFVWEIAGGGSPRFEISSPEEKEDVALKGVLGERFLAASIGKKFAVYDLAGDGKPRFILASDTPNDSVKLLDKTKDGNFIAVADDNKISVLETEGAGKPLYEIKRDSEKERFTLIKFLEEKNYFLVGRVNRSEKKPERTEIYDIESGRLQFTIPAGFSQNVRFTPDEKLLYDEELGSTRIWNLASKKFLHIPITTYITSSDDMNNMTSEYNIEQTSLSPDGKFVLKYGGDIVSVFDLETGKELQKLSDPDHVKYYKKTNNIKKSGLRDAGWSDDGRFIYALGENWKTVNFWKAAD